MLEEEQGLLGLPGQGSQQGPHVPHSVRCCAEPASGCRSWRAQGQAEERALKGRRCSASCGVAAPQGVGGELVRVGSHQGRILPPPLHALARVPSAHARQVAGLGVQEHNGPPRGKGGQVSEVEDRVEANAKAPCLGALGLLALEGVPNALNGGKVALREDCIVVGQQGGALEGRHAGVQLACAVAASVQHQPKVTGASVVRVLNQLLEH